jgi:hypothetical protein
VEATNERECDLLQTSIAKVKIAGRLTPISLLDIRGDVIKVEDNFNFVRSR